MDERGRVLTAVLVGAAVGGAVGYLYMTEGGKRFREQMEPRLDDALREIARLRKTIVKAQAVVSEGWRSITEFAGEANRGEFGQGGRQSSPF